MPDNRFTKEELIDIEYGLNKAIYSISKEYNPDESLKSLSARFDRCNNLLEKVRRM